MNVLRRVSERVECAGARGFLCFPFLPRGRGRHSPSARSAKAATCGAATATSCSRGHGIAGGVASGRGGEVSGAIFVVAAEEGLSNPGLNVSLRALRR